MATENKSGNTPATGGAPQDLPADAVQFIGQKFQELKQELAHAIARLEAVEKQLGETIDKDLDKAGRKAGAAIDDTKSWLDKLFS